MKRQTVKEWLEKNVAKTSEGECWNAAESGFNKRGWHVCFKAEGKRHLAHRAAWAEANGPIPGGMFVLHRCDNPKCCNPSHLFLGSQSDNAKDMWGKGRGRTVSRAGVKLGPSKSRMFIESQIIDIFEMYIGGKSQKCIASVFNTTDVTISNILRGKIYPEFSSLRESVAHLMGRGVKKRLAASAGDG